MTRIERVFAWGIDKNEIFLGEERKLDKVMNKKIVQEAFSYCEKEAAIHTSVMCIDESRQTHL